MGLQQRCVKNSCCFNRIIFLVNYKKILQLQRRWKHQHLSKRKLCLKSSLVNQINAHYEIHHSHHLQQMNHPLLCPNHHVTLQISRRWTPNQSLCLNQRSQWRCQVAQSHNIYPMHPYLLPQWKYLEWQLCGNAIICQPFQILINYQVHCQIDNSY